MEVTDFRSNLLDRVPAPSKSRLSDMETRKSLEVVRVIVICASSDFGVDGIDGAGLYPGVENDFL